MGEIKVILLEGSPRECGLKYGSACAKEIGESIANYTALFMDRKGMSWENAIAAVSEFMPYIEAADSGYMEEMEGVAEGAGVRLEDIAVLNARTELLHTGVSMCAGTHPEECQECTAFSALPPATANGGVIIGQTWDFSYMQRNATVAVKRKGSGGKPDMLMFLEAGMIGGKGMNSCGIGLTLNALKIKHTGEGLPLHIRMRMILEASTMAQAYERATSGPVASAANLIITHRDGVALDLELDPESVEVLLPQDGLIVHTNHFIGPRQALRHGLAISGSTYIRLQRARQLLCASEKISVEYIEKVFCDHVGYPTSICAHPNKTDPEIKWNSTNFAVIMDLSNMEAYTACGNPCETGFQRMSM